MKNAGFWSMVVGGTMALGAILLGLVGFMASMVRSFAILEKSGVGDPRELSQCLSGALMAGAGGFVVSSVGLLIFVIGLVVWSSAKSKIVPPPLPVQE